MRKAARLTHANPLAVEGAMVQVGTQPSEPLEKYPLSLWSKALAIRLALLDQSSQSFLHHMDSLVGRRGPDYHTKNQSFVYTLSFVSLTLNTEKLQAWSDQCAQCL